MYVNLQTYFPLVTIIEATLVGIILLKSNTRQKEF